jgi:hypothetical protein
MVVRHQTRRKNSRPPRRAAGPSSEDEAKMAPGMRCVLPSAEYGHVAAANYISRPRWAAASVGATSPQSWPRYFVLSVAIPRARSHCQGHDTLAVLAGPAESCPMSWSQPRPTSLNAVSGPLTEREIRYCSPACNVAPQVAPAGTASRSSPGVADYSVLFLPANLIQFRRRKSRHHECEVP